MAPGGAETIVAPVGITAPTQIGRGWPAATTVAPGDWARNGHSDLMLIRSDGALMLYAGLAGQRFAAPVQVGRGWQVMNLVVGGVDWNQDGRMDLIARHTDGRLLLYPGNGRGGFLASKQIGKGWNGMRHVVPVQRSLGGQPAVIATDANGRMHIYPTVDGRFTTRVSLGYGWNAIRLLAQGGDWNKDGHTDLLAVTDGGDLRLYAGADRATFASSVLATGWQSLGMISVANQTSLQNDIWAVRDDGALLSYPSIFAAPAATRPNGATSPWPSTRPASYSGIWHSENGRIDSEMCTIPFMPTNRMHCRAINDLVNLNNAYLARFGRDLPIDTWPHATYRTYADQLSVWEEIGPPIAATPGTSPHGWGQAIDFYEEFGYGTAENIWLDTKGPNYGWSRMPWHDEGGSYGEWWHFDYVR